MRFGQILLEAVRCHKSLAGAAGSKALSPKRKGRTSQMSSLTSLTKFILVLALGALALAAVPHAVAQADVAHFNLFPNPKFVSCLGVQGGPTPTASVTVTRGKKNDTLVISAKNIKPGLAFD